MRRLILAVLCVLALAAPAGAAAKTILGVTGNADRFQGQTAQDSLVDSAFLGWNQGVSYGSPLPVLFKTLAPIPMIHIGTYGKSGKGEIVTPASIADGKGDPYLAKVNQAISQWGNAIYVRPLAEMNNGGNIWSAYTSSGAVRGAAYTPAEYRKAFARIYLLLHGGTAADLTAKLKALGMPGVTSDFLVNAFPRLRVLWSPLAGGTPKVAGNDPENYYPGDAYVDVAGGRHLQGGRQRAPLERACSPRCAGEGSPQALLDP